MRIHYPKVTSIRSAVSAESKRDKSSESCRCIGVGRTNNDTTLYAVRFERQLNNEELMLFSQKLMQMGDLSHGGIRSIQSVSGELLQETAADGRAAEYPESEPDVTSGAPAADCACDAPDGAPHTASCPAYDGPRDSDPSDDVGGILIGSGQD